MPPLAQCWKEKSYISKSFPSTGVSSVTSFPRNLGKLELCVCEMSRLAHCWKKFYWPFIVLHWNINYKYSLHRPLGFWFCYRLVIAGITYVGWQTQALTWAMSQGKGGTSPTLFCWLFVTSSNSERNVRYISPYALKKHNHWVSKPSILDMRRYGKKCPDLYGKDSIIYFYVCWNASNTNFPHTFLILTYICHSLWGID